jgi:hypothetical protein
MEQGRLKSQIAILMAICVFVTCNLAYAAETPPTRQHAAASEGVFDEPSGEGMVFDLLVLRPCGIVATVLGTTFFVVSLPFTLPTKSVKQAAKKLVAEPAKYTFARPLGQP